MTKWVPPLVVILGETASGKSHLALKLAEHFQGEIICADSMTIYKGFDIGTAKPTSLDRTRIRHHLLDLAYPSKKFNSEAFQRLATDAISDITARNKVPFLVGGSGLYIDSILFSYTFLSPPLPGVRKRLNQMNISELLQGATKLGLNTESIDIHNKRRIVRLIESNGHQPIKQPLRSNTVVIGLQLSRENVETHIRQRVEKMIALGLEAEVRNLAQIYGWKIEQMKAVGYREWQDYFNGTISHAELMNLIIKDTIALVKKQYTWFKRNKSIHWFSTGYSLGEIVDLVTTELNK